jgi:hypothetical protein
VGWALAILGDMAVRLGKTQEAWRWYGQAKAVNPRDYFVLLAFADVLLDASNPQGARDIVEGYTHMDAMLLRLLLAEKALGGKDVETTRQVLSRRIAEAAARGESAHLRDHARYFLDIAQDPARALAYASQNWRTQKEPADALILLRAAQAAGDARAEREVIAWQRRAGREDARFDALAGRP